MTATMLAARLRGGGEVELVECERPEPGPGQVRVRVQGCGICASNVPVFEGRPWFEYPRTPGEGGHEGWGVVDAHGAGVASPPLGARVAFLSERAFCQYDVAAAGELAAVPPQLQDAPAPGEPLGCAVNVFRRSGVRAGHRVAIVGLGFLGALLVQLAVRRGAEVLAISRQPFARELALRLGCARVASWDDGADAIVAAVMEHTRGDGCERVIEVTGKQAPLDLATRLATTHGRLVIAGYHQDGRREVDMQTWNWRCLDVVNAHERCATRRTAGMRQALQLVADGVIDPSPLYSMHVALNGLADGLAATARRPEGFYKALVEVPS